MSQVCDSSKVTVISFVSCTAAPSADMRSLELEEVDERASDIIRGEVDARIAFNATLEELTHMGRHAPMKDEPKKPFSRESRDKLVGDIKKHADEVEKYLASWFDLVSACKADGKLGFLQGIRSGLMLDFVEGPIPDFPRSPSPSRRLTEDERAERDKRLDELTQFSELEQLFKDDSDACVAVFCSLLYHEW